MGIKKHRRTRKHKRLRKTRRQSGGGGQSFHILIATAGRPLLKGLLDSMKGQLNAYDAVTIVFDGPTAKEKSGMDSSWINGFKAKVNVFEEIPALGQWGHGIRNKYQSILQPKTTFVMHADDDDIYTSGAFDALRLKCIDPDILYVAKMNSKSHPETLIPRQNGKILMNDIGTPCGITPFDKAGASKWENNYGGDFKYYNGLQTHVKGVVFLDDVIYTVGK